MLKLENINFAFGDNSILKNFSHTFTEGEVTSIVGASGVGKSTLFSIISGSLKPISGKLILKDQDITDIKVEKRMITTMFQFESLFSHMNVFENIAFALNTKFHKERFKEVDQVEYIRDILKSCGLEGFGKRDINSLSGGQKQRVALARTIALRPHVILLDEPFSALDEALSFELNNLVRELVKKLGIIAIKITHDQDDAINFSDEIILLTPNNYDVFSPSKATIPNKRVILFFGLGVIEENLFIPIKSLSVDTISDTYKFNFQVLSSKKRGHYNEYILLYLDQRISFFSDQHFNKEITLYADKDLCHILN